MVQFDGHIVPVGIISSDFVGKLFLCTITGEIGGRHSLDAGINFASTIHYHKYQQTGFLGLFRKQTPSSSMDSAH